MNHTPVLIVGGSLVGLSTSLFLAWRGVHHVLLEKHAGSSPHPRAMGFTEHTLEFYRAAGIGDRVPQVPPDARLRRVQADSLAGAWTDTIPWTPGQHETPPSVLSPCTGAAIAQDRLEPILRVAALERGADLRYRQQLLDWREVEDGIVARIAERDTGIEYELHADYMIACDGADSAIREQLGIARKGVGHLRTLRSVLFRCVQADDYLARGVQQFEIEQPGTRAFLTSYGEGRWVLMFEDDRERSEAQLKQAVRSALGADMAFEIITTGRWELAGRIAERYSEGRVFLAGDAAHQLPPTRGGFGANTGIDDAYNLAWKLQRVLAGTAMPALLDTYHAERQPIGWLRHQQTFARPDHARWQDKPVLTPLYSNEAMEFGQLLRSPAILGAGPELPPAADPGTWAGQPGTRAPHVWIERDGERLSTIDLFTRNFTLVSEDPRWITAMRAVAAKKGLAVDLVQVGTDVQFPATEDFRKHFGVSAEGASLVRPDGVVAWRSPGAVDAPATCLADVLVRVACTCGQADH